MSTGPSSSSGTIREGPRMAEVTRRRTGEFVRKLFEILLAHPEGIPAREALQMLVKDFELTPYEAGEYESGTRRFEKIVRFATVDCVKAEWLLKEKGRWSITEAGRQAYEQFPDPEAFYRRAVQLYREWKASRPAVEQKEAEDQAQDETLGKAVSITFEQAEEQAWAEIKVYLEGMPPYEFQKLVAALLRAMGYHVQWVAPPGKDGGVDIFASADPLGARPPRIKVQVKRQQQAVNVENLRSFLAVLGEDDVGLFVATGGFTRDATDEARLREKRKISLIDLDRLFDLWVEHYSKLTDDARQRLPLKPIYFLAPED